MMQARMNHPVFVVPDAMKALKALSATTEHRLPQKLLELVHLRASQINGCSVCVDMHPKIARKSGETDERLFAVAAWRLIQRGRARRAGFDRGADAVERPRRSGARPGLERGSEAVR